MKKLSVKIVCIVLLACVLTLAFFGCGKKDKNNTYTAYAVSQASFPQMTKFSENNYSEWRNDRNRQIDQPAGYKDGMERFFSSSASMFLSGEDANELYAPLSLYFALAMLAETAKGETRTQILNVLGAENVETLRQKVNSAWNANYVDDGTVTSLMANSLWLNESCGFDKNVCDLLANDYYASTFRGKMGEEKFNEALRGWLNAMTKNFLKDYVNDEKFSGSTLFALVSAIYFNARWEAQFSELDTRKEPFYLANGSEKQADFMHNGFRGAYYYADKFSAVDLSFRNAGSMSIILPDEGVTPHELLSDATAQNLMYGDRSDVGVSYLNVNISLPKFDVSGKTDLKKGLKALGMTSAFDADEADFTRLTGNTPAYVSDVLQAVRVKTDEEGCEAAAYTIVYAENTAMPIEETVNFVVNRPFIFVVNGIDGLPLFMGIVGNP
ncbi:MAG: hypothetical protein IK048_03465 [Clostridia bacterium]|nr:hypothetical protein [Clostridia bacterium]